MALAGGPHAPAGARYSWAGRRTLLNGSIASESAEDLLQELSEVPALFVGMFRIVIETEQAEASAIGRNIEVFGRQDFFIALFDLVPAALKRQRDTLLVSVDVVERLQLTIFPDPSREIGDVHGYGL